MKLNKETKTTMNKTVAHEQTPVVPLDSCILGKFLLLFMSKMVLRAGLQYLSQVLYLHEYLMECKVGLLLGHLASWSPPKKCLWHPLIPVTQTLLQFPKHLWGSNGHLRNEFLLPFQKHCFREWSVPLSYLGAGCRGVSWVQVLGCPCFVVGGGAGRGCKQLAPDTLDVAPSHPPSGPALLLQ